jgi:hypothetical protein
MDLEPEPGPSAPKPPASTGLDGRTDKLSETARGWHTIQIAVLGFVGICGVLRTADASTPTAVQVVAGVLAAAAFVAALAGVLAVARVAYPLDPVRTEGDLAGLRERLRRGIRTTIVALALVVVAALSGWWPHSADAGATTGSASLSVTDAQGRNWCGTLVAGTGGTVSLRTADGVVDVPSGSIAAVETVANC